MMGGMLRWVAALAIVIGLSPLILGQTPTRLPAPSVIFNGQRVPIDSTWVDQKGVSYVALRDLVRFLGGQTLFLRHLDAYEVAVPAQGFAGSKAMTFRIFSNAVDMTVGGVEKPFKTPTFYFDGQFYVPFEAVLNRAGYQVVSRADGAIQIRVPDESKPFGRSTISASVVPTPPAGLAVGAPTVNRVDQPKPVSGSATVNGAAVSAKVTVVATPAIAIASGNKGTMGGAKITGNAASAVMARGVSIGTPNPVQQLATPSLSIAFGPRVYSLTGRYVSENGVVYADMDAVLRREGLMVIRRPDAFEIVRGQTVYRLTSGNADLRVGVSGKIEIKKIPHPLRMVGGTPYLSIDTVASMFQLGVVWEMDRNRAHLVNRLLQLRIEKSGGSGQLVFVASRPILSQAPRDLGDDNGVVLELSDLQLPQKEWIQEAKDGPIRRVLAQQVTPTRVRMTVWFSGDFGASQLNTTSSGAVMSVAGRVSRIQQSVLDGRVSLKLIGVGMLGAQIWRIPSTDTLVVDVPDTYTLLPQVVRPIPDAPFESIRTSQFSAKPPSTRIVLNLADGVTFDVKARLTDRIELTFPVAAVPTASVVATQLARVSSGAVSVTESHPVVTPSINRIATAAPSGTTRNVAPPTSRPVVLRSAPRHSVLHRKIVVIDPGHGGGDPGGIAADNTYEKALTIDISRRLKLALEAQGAVVIMCRQNDENPSLQARSDMGNFNNADLFVSVHINSFFHSYANGTETYYYKPSDKPLAVAVHQEMVGALGFRDNGVKRARLYVLRNTRMPAVLVEPGFITNPLEFERMAMPDVRQKIAQAITTGILNYLAQPRDLND